MWQYEFSLVRLDNQTNKSTVLPRSGFQLGGGFLEAKLQAAKGNRNMHQSEDSLAQAERHLQEAEQRVLRQIEMIANLGNHGHEHMAREARGLLATLEETVNLAWHHLRIERKERGLRPRYRSRKRSALRVKMRMGQHTVAFSRRKCARHGRRYDTRWCDVAESLGDVVAPRLEEGRLPEPYIEHAAARYIEALLDGDREPTEPERPYVERLRALDEQIEASGGWKPDAPQYPETEQTKARTKARKRAQARASHQVGQ